MNRSVVVQKQKQIHVDKKCTRTWQIASIIGKVKTIQCFKLPWYIRKVA
jgi:hypothetical protein